jgi:muconolactone delta-isomerase
VIVQYLVTMTTRVPNGTDDDEVDRIRGLEAARSRELAAAHTLLRLWRPPLLPGEWRTLGLFEASDDYELAAVLASMPLHVWRSDDVQALGPHPNDPVVPSVRRPTDSEFLTRFTVTVPSDAEEVAVTELSALEAARIQRLADEGHLLRLWMLPPIAGSWRALGLWGAEDAADLGAMLRSLPMDRWMSVEATPLAPHPSDPDQTTLARKSQPNGGNPGRPEGKPQA